MPSTKEVSARARELADERETLKAEIKALNEEEQRKREELDLAAILERIRRERKKRLTRLIEVEQLQSRLVAEVGISNREKELTERIKDLTKREHHARQDGTDRHGRVPEQYVEQPLEHFRQKLVFAEQHVAEVERYYVPGPNIQPGPRIIEARRRLKDAREEFADAEKLCAIGARIREMRAERKKLEAERDRLAAQRRENVLAGK
jgi:hypothetical protein